MSSDLSLRESYSLDNVVARSSADSVEGLAWLVAVNDGVSVGKVAALAGISKGELQRLLTDRVFRDRVSELLVLAEMSVEKERGIAKRFIEDAENGALDVGDRLKASEFVFRQAGLLRAEKREVSHGGGIRVSFSVDAPEGGSGYESVDPLGGVEGAEVLDVEGVVEDAD